MKILFRSAAPSRIWLRLSIRNSRSASLPLAMLLCSNAPRLTLRVQSRVSGENLRFLSPSALASLGAYLGLLPFISATGGGMRPPSYYPKVFSLVSGNLSYGRFPFWYMGNARKHIWQFSVRYGQKRILSAFLSCFFAVFCPHTLDKINVFCMIDKALQCQRR